MPNFSATRTAPHRFVQEGFDTTDMEALGEVYDSLDERDISTRAKLEDFILDWEELSAVQYEAYSLAYIDMTVDTGNPDYETRYMKIVDELVPVKEQRDFALKRKLLASPAVDESGRRVQGISAEHKVGGGAVQGRERAPDAGSA